MANILVIDDEEQMRDLLDMMLTDDNHSVKTASDGVEGLLACHHEKFDLIITDINMPNMGGLEFIKKARALTGFRFIPILTLTTESQQGKRDEGKKAGATGWLVKPVSGPDLLKIIKQVLPGA